MVSAAAINVRRTGWRLPVLPTTISVPRASEAPRRLPPTVPLYAGVRLITHGVAGKQPAELVSTL